MNTGGAPVHRLPARLSAPAAARACGRAGRRAAGQSLAEFALIVPIMFLIAIAVADFGRLFSSAVATESAAREAADYGAFLGSARWASSDSPWTTNDQEMRRRACSAASQLQGYANASANCDDNPTMTWEILSRNNTSSPYHVVNPNAVPDECSGRTGLTDPCVVHVTVTFVFRPFLAIPPIPSSIPITRESWFAVSDLTGT